MMSNNENIQTQFPEIWKLMCERGWNFVTAKEFFDNQNEAKNERKNSLRNKASMLFDQMEKDYSQDRDEIAEIKSQLISAIEEVYSVKQTGMLDIQETKSEILSAMSKAFEDRDSEFKQKMNIAIEIVGLLQSEIDRMRQAEIEYREAKKECNLEAKNYNEKLHELVKLAANLQKNYNSMVDNLNKQSR
jgi:uncharacterized protein YukE